MDDFGVPLFLETSIYSCKKSSANACLASCYSPTFPSSVLASQHFGPQARAPWHGPWPHRPIHENEHVTVGVKTLATGATGRCPFLDPIQSMYGIFTYIWLIFMVNVGKYTIHGWYGDCMTGKWTGCKISFVIFGRNNLHGSFQLFNVFVFVIC